MGTPQATAGALEQVAAADGDVDICSTKERGDLQEPAMAARPGRLGQIKIEDQDVRWRGRDQSVGRSEADEVLKRDPLTNRFKDGRRSHCASHRFRCPTPQSRQGAAKLGCRPSHQGPNP